MNLFFIINFFLLIIYTNEDTKTAVKITATSGIINKVNYAKTKILSFNIPCQVDNNITNNISRVDITFKTKRLEDNKEFDSICHLNSVRLDSDANYINTYLSCKLDYANYENENFDDDINLVIEGNPTYTSDIVEFTFEHFNQIGQSIEIGGLSIFNADNNDCNDNFYHFKMNFTSFPYKPLESTICRIGLSNNDIHNTARCAIPLYNYDILCSLDISEKKIEKGEKIEINSQSQIKCQNGQILKIVDNAKNILEIGEECDEGFFLIFTKFYLYILFLIILF